MLPLVVRLAVLLPALAALVSPPRSPLLPPSWRLVTTGPAGGAIWQGPLHAPPVAALRRETLVYLPPDPSRTAHYPLVVLLQGLPGAPYSYSGGLALAQVADTLIEARRVPPFVAVMPPAGMTPLYDGEWAGRWETFLIRDVLRWTQRLPVSRGRAERSIAGLSAGGYGAVDIALRHPRLFGTIESWSGYFGAPHDGPLRGASREQRLAHDPYVLTAREAPLLRRLGTRFFVESATTADRASARAARRFAHELHRFHLPYRLLLAPGGHDGAFWRAHLATALQYALAPYAAERTTPSSS